MRVIEACTKSGGATHSCSDARQAQRAGIVRWRVGPDGERGEAGEARVVMVCSTVAGPRATSAVFTRPRFVLKSAVR